VVELGKFVSNWISRSNLSEFKGKKAVVQDVRVENGMYGESLVIVVKVLDGDYPLLKMRLNRFTVRKLVGQGVKDSDQLIGKTIVISDTDFRGMRIPTIDIIPEDEGMRYETGYQPSPRMVETKQTSGFNAK